MPHLKVLCVFGIIALSGFHDACTTETKTSAGFRYFLQQELKGYDTWLKTAENADPTPQIQLGYSFGNSVFKNLFDMWYTIRYQEVVGLVTQVDQRILDYIYVDLVNLHFSIGLTTKGKITYQGNYTANGDMVTGEKFEGDGLWKVVCTSVKDVHNFTFQISKEGFVDITSRNGYWYMHTILEVDDEQTEFEGLWDNGTAGFDTEIRKQMGIEIAKKNDDSFNDHPTGALLRRFLNETFQKVSLREIMATEDEQITEPPETSRPEPTTVKTTRQQKELTTESTGNSNAIAPLVTFFSVILFVYGRFSNA